jgi:hypothetical protein
MLRHRAAQPDHIAIGTGTAAYQQMLDDTAHGIYGARRTADAIPTATTLGAFSTSRELLASGTCAAFKVSPRHPTPQ